MNARLAPLWLAEEQVTSPNTAWSFSETIVDGRMMRNLEDSGFIDRVFAAQGVK